MAEALILKVDYPLSVKPDSWTQEKWDGRQRIGDIVEIQDNGFYRIETLGTGRAGWDRNTFAVIRIPSVSLATARKFAGNHSVSEVLVKKFRFQVPIATLAWNKNMVTINGKVFEEWYLDVNNITQAKIVDKAG